MLKHYTNRLKEYAQEDIDQLEEIGIRASIGDPCATETHSVKQIQSIGIVGIYVEASDDDNRSGNEIVKAAWDIELQKED